MDQVVQWFPIVVGLIAVVNDVEKGTQNLRCQQEKEDRFPRHGLAGQFDANFDFCPFFRTVLVTGVSGGFS